MISSLRKYKSLDSTNFQKNSIRSVFYKIRSIHFSHKLTLVYFQIVIDLYFTIKLYLPLYDPKAKSKLIISKLN
ncbi:hypothetical protein LEP1GSC067_0931 [Leptospira interrogans serovar Lora str. TE 1992]|uniref:Uncharacterized protein n=1 Tax=Leptospira interrogans serovar Lora str. TE 1992 TaxID=1193028 RepID=M3EU75_LEPIR|nr:hypothetical protein LEP1GSC067_0931 [Leptospira interrogans serovar Lora str. TE 1992]MBE0304765.1 hypothetical protein [Leptospira interrogans serovar Yeoncheon]